MFSQPSVGFSPDFFTGRKENKKSTTKNEESRSFSLSTKRITEARDAVYISAIIYYTLAIGSEDLDA